MTTWTHVTPRSVDECPGDVAPKLDELGFYLGTSDQIVHVKRAVCKRCSRRIRPMRRNEGPEALRSLLRF